jgi:DNA polymerase III epsilon subunit-like protein
MPDHRIRRVARGAGRDSLRRVPGARGRALPRFCEFVEDLPLVAYNVAFDMGFLRAEAARQRVRIDNKPVCALAVARAKLPDLPNHKLSTVARHLGVEREQTHRALEDCEIGLRVFSELMRP